MLLLAAAADRRAPAALRRAALLAQQVGRRLDRRGWWLGAAPVVLRLRRPSIISRAFRRSSPPARKAGIGRTTERLVVAGMHSSHPRRFSLSVRCDAAIVREPGGCGVIGSQSDRRSWRRSTPALCWAGVQRMDDSDDLALSAAAPPPCPSCAAERRFPSVALATEGQPRVGGLRLRVRVGGPWLFSSSSGMKPPKPYRGLLWRPGSGPPAAREPRLSPR